MVFCHWDFVTTHICQESDIFICSSSCAKNDTKVAKQVWSSFFRIEKFYNLSKYNIIISFASFADCSTKKPSWLIMIIASNSHQHTTTNVEKCLSLNCRGIAVDLLVSAGRLVPHWLGSSTFVLKSATCSCVWLVCNPLPSSNVAVQVVPRVGCVFVSSQGWASLPSQMLSTSLLAWRAIADKDCAIRIDWLC